MAAGPHLDGPSVYDLLERHSCSFIAVRPTPLHCGERAMPAQLSVCLRV